jgi:predicted acylesterase/phospholipase RssA
VDWVCGLSSGALNATVIAGNTEADRAPKLRELWASFGRMARTGPGDLGRLGVRYAQGEIYGPPV